LATRAEHFSSRPLRGSPHTVANPSGRGGNRRIGFSVGGRTEGPVARADSQPRRMNIDASTAPFGGGSGVPPPWAPRARDLFCVAPNRRRPPFEFSTAPRNCRPRLGRQPDTSSAHRSLKQFHSTLAARVPPCWRPNRFAEGEPPLFGSAPSTVFVSGGPMQSRVPKPRPRASKKKKKKRVPPLFSPCRTVRGRPSDAREATPRYENKASTAPETVPANQAPSITQVGGSFGTVARRPLCSSASGAKPQQTNSSPTTTPPPPTQGWQVCRPDSPRTIQGATPVISRVSPQLSHAIDERSLADQNVVRQDRTSLICAAGRLQFNPK